MATAQGHWSRRQFLKGMLAAGAAPYVVSASAFGAATHHGRMANTVAARSCIGPLARQG